jgi:prophage regulatory protein
MRFLTFPELRPQKGITYSRHHLRRKCNAGEFPKPVPLSEQRIAWLEDEIDAWIEAKAAQRKGAA